MPNAVSISNLAWSPAEDSAVLALLRRYDVRAIDVVPKKFFDDPATATTPQIAAARTRWADSGIAFAGMQSLLYGTQGLNVFGSPDIQEKLLEHLRHICRIGGELGATRLVFGSPRNRDRAGLDDTAALEIAVHFFRRLGDIAAANGVLVCLEPNPAAYHSNFMCTADETAAVVRATVHHAIRMQLDTGALTLNGEDVRAVLAAHASLIGHIHASEPHLVPLGTGTTDHAAMAAAVKNTLPNHIVCIEMAETKEGANLQHIEQALALATTLYPQ
jgi:sugar phosphate isomerase/epimerase